MSKRLLLSITVMIAVGLSIPSPARAGLMLLGPTPYRSFADSPFNGTTFGYFYLEDGEDGAFNVPGITAISNTPGTTFGAIGPGLFGDSVDGDDGSIDGLGQNGRSFADPNNRSTENLGYTFVFDPTVLGALPTHVGIVWTDGGFRSSTQVSFFGPADELLGTIGPVQVGDTSFAGTTAEDRFFGAINTDGIRRFTIRSPVGNANLEVDHIQYGGPSTAPVPEPSTITLAGSGLLVLIAHGRRRRLAGNRASQAR